MAAARVPHPIRNHPGMARTVSEGFWALVIGIIVAYVFFVALGAFSPGDVLGISVAVGVLLVLTAIHGLRVHRDAAQGQDPRLAHARERRGF